MHPLRLRVALKFAKTVPDSLYVLERRLPAFVYGGAVDELPAFTFHDVTPDFERAPDPYEAGYRTAGADEIEARLAGKPRDAGWTHRRADLR